MFSADAKSFPVARYVRPSDAPIDRHRDREERPHPRRSFRRRRLGRDRFVGGLDPDGIVTAGSDSATQSFGVGVDVVQAAKKLFGPKNFRADPLEKYTSDPDY